MARAHLYDFVRDVTGRVLSATVTVYEPGTTTAIAATLYAGPTGGTTVANPITTDVAGFFEFFLDAGQQVNLKISAPGMADRTLSYVTVGDDPASTVRIAGTQSVTGQKTFSSPILNNATLTSPILSGQVLLANGSAAAPTLAQNASSDTGLYFPGTDELAIAIAGAEAVRVRVGAVEAKLRDKGGWTFNLEAFAGGVTINNGTDVGGACTAAWTAAIAAVTAVGGGTITVGPGIFLTNIVLPDYTWVVGSGPNTVLKHNDSNLTPIINAVDKTSCGVAMVTVDGNRTGGTNNHNTTGFNNSELAMDGIDNTVYMVWATNWNKTAISPGGLRNAVLYARCKGPALGTPTTPSYTDVSAAQTDFGALYGIAVSGPSYCEDLIFHGCVVSGTRSAGIITGGKRPVLSACRTNDVHRYSYPTTPTPTGGGSIAWAMTWDGVNLPKESNVVGATDAAVIGCHVGPTLTPTYASGFEPNSVNRIVFSGCTVNGVPGSAFAIDGTASRVLLDACSINGCGTGISVIANLQRLSFVNCILSNITGNAVVLAGTTDYYKLIGCHFEANGTNWANTASGTNWVSIGHTVEGTGGTVPERLNGNLTLAGVLTAGDISLSNGLYTTMATAPTLNQGGTVAATLNYARYRLYGRMAHVMVSFTATAVGTASNAIRIILPAASPNLSSVRTGDVAIVGGAVYFKAGTGWKSGQAIAFTATSIQFARDDQANYFGTASDPNTIAIGDHFAVDLIYELV